MGVEGDVQVGGEQLVHRVMQRVELTLDRRLREAIAAVVLEHSRELAPALRERIEAVVSGAVSEALAEELPPSRRKPDARGRALGEDQAAALTAIAVSGRVVDVLVGPAGAGKTTAMSALRRAWEKEHGAGSVIGLAPSAVAAQVLADLGIATENTAKWWQNHLMHGTTFEAGQLLIIDEASLAGTASLDRITREVENARSDWKREELN